MGNTARSTPSPKAPPGWYVRLRDYFVRLRDAYPQLRDDIVAARGSLITAAAYAVILLVPDQSAEAIRTTFGSTSGWQWLVLFGWYFLLSYAATALVGSAALGFTAVDRQPASQVKTATAYRHTTLRKGMLYLLSAAPGLITIVAVFISMAPTFWYIFHIPVIAWVFICLCVVSIFYGYILVHQEDVSTKSTVDRTRRESEATTEQTQPEAEATTEQTQPEGKRQPTKPRGWRERQSIKLGGWREC